MTEATRNIATLLAPILAVLNQIDAMRRPPMICKSCRWRDGKETGTPGYKSFQTFPRCLLGYKPLNLDDGCNDWERKWSLPLGDGRPA